MPDHKQQYTSEFKAKVALKALARNKKNLEPLSEEYNVPVSLILIWAVQLERNAAGVYEVSSEPTDVDYEPIPVDIDVESREVAASIEQGVMSDTLNYKRLTSWTILGLMLVAVFTQMLIEMFQITTSKSPEQVIGEDAFHQVTHKKREAKVKLSSFGVVDAENDVYHVPIDMVIKQMAEDAVPDTVADELLEQIDPTPIE